MDTCLDDHSRVVLSQQDKITGSDYINASYIDVSFLCTIKICNEFGYWIYYDFSKKYNAGLCKLGEFL